MALSENLVALRRLEVGHLLSAGTGELAERIVRCLPSSVRQRIAHRDRRLLVCPQGESAQLSLAIGTSRQPLGGIAVRERESVPLPIPEADRKSPHRTELLLPADAVLIRRISLPAQVRENLAQAIAFELDRLSPFRPDQVLFDFAVLPGSKGDLRVRADLAICRREQVGAWIGRLRDAGSPIDRVTWEGAWPKANLLPAAERPHRRQPLLEPLRLLAALVAALMAAVLISPLWQKSQLLTSLEGEIKRARTQAVQVDEVRQELERARRGSTEVLRQKIEQPRMLDLLRELTERIPEDTWVQSLEYRNGEVEVRGESKQATALIGLLEGAPGIDGVSFRSPVTQIARTGNERFNLAFNYRPREGAAPSSGDAESSAGPNPGVANPTP